MAQHLSVPDDPPVVYLSHEDGDLHGYRLGHNFIDFIDKWTQIGCPGLKDWQLEPFIESETSTINPNGKRTALERVVWVGGFSYRRSFLVKSKLG